MRDRVASAAGTVLVLVVMIAITLGPFPQPDLPGRLDQLPHVIAYATATLLLLPVVHGSGSARPRPLVVATVGGALVALGAMLELGQRFVDRDVELFDVIANALGVVVGTGVWTITRRVRSSEGRRP